MANMLHRKTRVTPTLKCHKLSQTPVVKLKRLSVFECSNSNKTYDTTDFTISGINLCSTPNDSQYCEEYNDNNAFGQLSVSEISGLKACNIEHKDINENKDSISDRDQDYVETTHENIIRHNTITTNDEQQINETFTFPETYKNHIPETITNTSIINNEESNTNDCPEQWINQTFTLPESDKNDIPETISNGSIVNNEENYAKDCPEQWINQTFKFPESDKNHNPEPTSNRSIEHNEETYTNDCLEMNNNSCSTESQHAESENNADSNKNPDILEHHRDTNIAESLGDNDSDYQLSTETEYSEDEYASSEEIDDIPDTSRKSSTSQTRDTSASTSTSYICNKDVTVCDDEGLFLTASKSKGKEKRHFCIYCKTLQAKIARHLETVHRGEEDVKKFAQLPKGNSERRMIIDTIRKNGDFIHNTQAQFNTGELIVSRRPMDKKQRKATDFTVCAKCKGFFTKNNIRHHFRDCTGKKDGARIVRVLGRKAMGRIHKRACDRLREDVFPKLREDEITRNIRYDELLILHANKLCAKYGKDEYQHELIRSQLRLLGRLLRDLKEIDKKINEFSDLYHPRHYDTFIEAVHITAKFNKVTGTFATPSIATRLGTLIKQIGKLYVTECIKTENEQAKTHAENFMKILDDDYGIAINKVAGETLVQNKRQKKVVLPSNNDIVKLDNYLSQNRESAYAALTEQFSYQEWLRLAKVTLILVQTFNRRRAGEIERTTVKDFECYTGLNEKTNSEIFKSLPEASQKIAKKYVRFEIRGKLGRTVPVLLSSKCLDSIKLILKHRFDAGVPAANPYVFGLPSRSTKKGFKFLRACKLLSEYAVDCGASDPSSLRGTQLRKHIATKCMALGMNDNDTAFLANFMGHHEKIHRSHYRQPIPELELVRMPQYLELGQENNTNESEKAKKANKRKISQHSSSSESDLENVNLNMKEKKRRSTSPFGKTKRMRWSDEEKECIIKAFNTEIKERRLPKMIAIEDLRKRNACLTRRSGAQIKTWVHNIVSGKTKIVM